MAILKVHKRISNCPRTAQTPLTVWEFKSLAISGIDKNTNTTSSVWVSRGLPSRRKWLPGRDQLTPGRFVLLRGEWNIGDPLPEPSNVTGMRTAGTPGRRRRVVDRERGGGKATSTLKQEDWNKRLAWPREGKARAGPEVEKKRRRNRWGRGSVCGCWYGAQSCFAHHLPSSRTQPPFETAVRGSSGFFAPAVSSTLTCFFLFIFLYPPSPSPPSPFRLPSAPWPPHPRPVSPTVRQHSDVVCLNVPLLCSRLMARQFRGRYLQFNEP